ncbi:MAG: hypothetical protein AAF824_11740 [Bacteroidota bacterium]
MKKVQAKVVYQDISGGFWGIETQSGEKLQPDSDIPAKFKKDGLAVEVSYKPSSAFSIFMWGKSVEVLNISKA